MSWYVAGLGNLSGAFFYLTIPWLLPNFFALYNNRCLVTLSGPVHSTRGESAKTRLRADGPRQGDKASVVKFGMYQFVLLVIKNNFGRKQTAA